MRGAWSLFGWMLLVLITAAAIMVAVMVVRHMMDPASYPPLRTPPTTVADLPFVPAVTTPPVTTSAPPPTTNVPRNGHVNPRRPGQTSGVIAPVPQLGL